MFLRHSIFVCYDDNQEGNTDVCPRFLKLLLLLLLLLSSHHGGGGGLGIFSDWAKYGCGENIQVCGLALKPIDTHSIWRPLAVVAPVILETMLKLLFRVTKNSANKDKLQPPHTKGYIGNFFFLGGGC